MTYCWRSCTATPLQRCVTVKPSRLSLDQLGPCPRQPPGDPHSQAPATVWAKYLLQAAEFLRDHMWC